MDFSNLRMYQVGIEVPGWWFQIFGLFSIIYRIILPIDDYFSRLLKPPTSLGIEVM